MKTMMIQSLLPITALALIVEKDVSENQMNLELGMTMVYYCGDPKGDNDDGSRRRKTQHYRLMEGLIDEIHDDDTISVIDREGRHGIIDVSAIMYFQSPKIDFMPSPTIGPDASSGRDRTSSLDHDLYSFENMSGDKVRCTTAHLHVILSYLFNFPNKNCDNIEVLAGLTCELFMKSMMHHLFFYYKSSQFKHNERNINKDIQIHNSLKSEDLQKQLKFFWECAKYSSSKWKDDPNWQSYQAAFDKKYQNLVKKV